MAIKGSWLFRTMADRPWPFLIAWPVVLIILLAVGWSRDDYVEKEVNNIWIARDGEYWKDTQYADNLGKVGLPYTNFAAMAVSRDGSNLFTESRLNEIRARMQAAEATTIDYKGETYSWQDVCRTNNAGLGTVYQFPCARLSPMDLFQEANWFFDEQDKLTWYDKIVGDLLIQPRLPRFGILQGVCSSAGGATSQSDVCDQTLLLRTNPEYAVSQGYPPEYANPLALFSDIGDMEMNNPCRICIEQAFEETITRIQEAATGVFQVLLFETNRLFTTGDITDPVERGQLGALLGQLAQIVGSEEVPGMVTRSSIEEFYSYYVTRSLYAQLGAPAYVANYAAFMERLVQACTLANAGDASKCPTTVTPEEAAAALFQHADNTFSSVTTAGNPFPFWSEGDGTGALFAGTSPVSGSGVSLAGQLLSTVAYLDLQNFGQEGWSPLYSNGQFLDPLTPGQNWAALVETDPVYRWFLAGVTPMTSHCGNGNLTGTATGIAFVDDGTANATATLVTQRWCTQHNTPFEVDGDFTQQHFAKMWYDLVIDSPAFLGITQGESDPYVWTTGQGCGYDLKGSRFSYSNQTDTTILEGASRELYYVDEGVRFGAVDRNLLIGGATPAVGEYDSSNPLQTVTVVQTIYPTLLPKDIVERVSNCNRPTEAPDITEKDAEAILEAFKEAFEDSWTEGWDDDDAGEVQFVGFYDDEGVIGTTGRLLRDITLDNGTLTAVSIVVIAAFSSLFLFDFDLIESRVLITLVGVSLVIISYFAALGLAIIIGIKINITIAWTLPFIILGLGVDDTYMVLLAMKKQRQYTPKHFIAAMKEVVVPITMTSVVNASMFAVMNVVDIPAVYLTAQVAVIAVIFLYISVIMTYPAYCYIDMQRQFNRRYDVCFCRQKEGPEETTEEFKASQDHGMNVVLYDKVYRPLVLGDGKQRLLVHGIIWIIAFVLLGLGIWGTVDHRDIGLGLEDFFPKDHPAGTWATIRTEELASWSIGMNWGELEYTDPDTQMKMIKQFEDVVETPHVSQIDTKQLWMADFAVWTTRQCEANFDRQEAEMLECGRDQVFTDSDGVSSTCSGKWYPNTFGLRLKTFADPLEGTCLPYEGGICRPEAQMHPFDLVELGKDPTNPGSESWCPVLEGWSKEKLSFCLRIWREVGRSIASDGDFLLVDDSATENPDCQGEYKNDDAIATPIKFSSGPTMFAYNLTSHEVTLDMIEETREFCDDDDELHCWITGIAQDYWEQYLWVENVLLKICGASVAVGFGVAFIFLFAKIKYEGVYSTGRIAKGSLGGALLIALTTLLSLIAVIGLSLLAGVSLTAFSDMAFVLSVGFSVEYSVHVVHRFLKAPMRFPDPVSRVKHAMSFLTLPMFMAFVSSTIGVVCLAFTDFEFNTVFFFRPLIIVMFVTYFYGSWFLPVLLTNFDFDFFKLGKPLSMDSMYVPGQSGAHSGADEAVPVEESPESLEKMGEEMASAEEAAEKAVGADPSQEEFDA